MVNTIDQMRKFEMHVKLIQTAEELDSAVVKLDEVARTLINSVVVSLHVLRL